MTTLALAVTGLNVLVMVANILIVLRVRRDTRASIARLEAPEPPNRFAVYLMGDEVTMLEAQDLRSLAAALVRDMGYEITLTDRLAGPDGHAVPEEMRYRAEVWLAGREVLVGYKAQVDGPGSVPDEVPGIIGVPLWLTDAPTPGSAMQLASEWVVRNPRVAR